MAESFFNDPVAMHKFLWTDFKFLHGLTTNPSAKNARQCYYKRLFLLVDAYLYFNIEHKNPELLKKFFEGLFTNIPNYLGKRYHHPFFWKTDSIVQLALARHYRKEDPEYQGCLTMVRLKLSPINQRYTPPITIMDEQVNTHPTKYLDCGGFEPTVAAQKNNFKKDSFKAILSSNNKINFEITEHQLAFTLISQENKEGGHLTEFEYAKLSYNVIIRSLFADYLLLQKSQLHRLGAVKLKLAANERLHRLIQFINNRPYDPFSTERVINKIIIKILGNNKKRNARIIHAISCNLLHQPMSVDAVFCDLDKQNNICDELPQKKLEKSKVRTLERNQTMSLKSELSCDDFETVMKHIRDKEHELVKEVVTPEAYSEISAYQDEQKCSLKRACIDKKVFDMQSYQREVVSKKPSLKTACINSGVLSEDTFDKITSQSIVSIKEKKTTRLRAEKSKHRSWAQVGLNILCAAAIIVPISLLVAATLASHGAVLPFTGPVIAFISNNLLISACVGGAVSAAGTATLLSTDPAPRNFFKSLFQPTNQQNNINPDITLPSPLKRSGPRTTSNDSFHSIDLDSSTDESDHNSEASDNDHSILSDIEKQTFMDAADTSGHQTERAKKEVKTNPASCWSCLFGRKKHSEGQTPNSSLALQG